MDIQYSVEKMNDPAPGSNKTALIIFGVFVAFVALSIAAAIALIALNPGPPLNDSRDAILPESF